MPFLAPLDFQSAPGAALLEQIREEASPALAAMANHFARAFVVGSPWAPGFCCIGAELALDQPAMAAYGSPRLSVAGNGETPKEALISCLGEAADRLAVVERPGDVRTSMPVGEIIGPLAGSWISEAMRSSVDRLDGVDARDVLTGQPLALPADLCLRRAPERRRIEPVGALSSGVAAGPNFAAAAVRAGLELCERDAAALWWLGGRRPAAFPIEHPANAAATPLLAALRQGRNERRTMLLDITTDLGIPTIAAISLDNEGRGLACGFASRLDWVGAARGAVLEMCQMELAAPLAEAKRTEGGETALNAVDRQHLARAAFAASQCALLRPDRMSALAAVPGEPDDLQSFAVRLAARGVQLFAIDLTRADIGVAAARVVSAQLQPYSSDVVSDRLRDCRASNGGLLHVETASVPLM